MSRFVIRKRVNAFVVVGAIAFASASSILAQSNKLTPIQQRIQIQQQRLASSNAEERRDALMRLGAMNHPEASRVAMSALNDPEPVVRITAVHAIAAWPGSDASAALILLLADKQEVVRREAAHALGASRSKTAVQPLIALLTSDKEPAVRAAAAMALGRIRDEAAVVPLVNSLSGGGTKKKSGEHEFVMRAAAQSLGQIGSRAAVSQLVATLNDQEAPIDVRRAAAEALGAIGDPTASTALKAAVESVDPYLSQTARGALRRLR